VDVDCERISVGMGGFRKVWMGEDNYKMVWLSVYCYKRVWITLKGRAWDSGTET